MLERLDRKHRDGMARIVRYQKGDAIRYGELAGEAIRTLEGPFGEFRSAGAVERLADVRLLAPATPSKIVAVGPNFGAYFPNGGAPSRPTIWVKPASGLNDPDGVVELPPGVPVNHEVELAIVIGRRAKDVPPARAREHIFGFTCINDLSAGDMDSAEAFFASHYFVDGKIFDTFSPIGPWIETNLDVSNLRMQSRVNGVVRQSHSTADWLFSPDALVALITSMMTLLPGDVIATGSAPGERRIFDGDEM
jgi:2-keto-4-pentenoate hydratase/2-oxohepta-3-ene-1,7-dioic acid hydratase in catechol pathway